MGDEDDDDDECDGSRVCEDSEGGGKEKDSDCMPSVLGLSELPSGITTHVQSYFLFVYSWRILYITITHCI